MSLASVILVFNRAIPKEMVRSLNRSIRDGSSSDGIVRLIILLAITIPLAILVARAFARDRKSRKQKPHDHFADALALLPLSVNERTDLRALQSAGVIPQPLALLLCPTTYRVAVNAALVDSPNPDRADRYQALALKLFGPPTAATTPAASESAVPAPAAP